jgi:hypothetical protein
MPEAQAKLDDGFKTKFIGFIDILGFKKLVEAAESGVGGSLTFLKEITSTLGSDKDREAIVRNGPKICPHSAYIERDLDFQITQMSDSVLVSAEVSPAGAIAVVNHCWTVALFLMTKGIMVRGYVTQGSIHHVGSSFFGLGYQAALENEPKVSAFKRTADEKGTPFIEIDSAVCKFIQDKGDACVKEMFSRMVSRDGELTAVFPFKRLATSFIIAGAGHKFDGKAQKESNSNLRNNLIGYKKQILNFVDSSNEKAMNKASHYIAALDAQLLICDETDDVIDRLQRPFPSRSY